MAIPSPLVNGNYSLRQVQKNSGQAGALIVAISGTGTATVKLQYLDSGSNLVDLTDGLLAVGSEYIGQTGDLDVYLDVTGVTGSVYATIANKV